MGQVIELSDSESDQGETTPVNIINDHSSTIYKVNNTHISISPPDLEILTISPSPIRKKVHQKNPLLTESPKISDLISDVTNIIPSLVIDLESYSPPKSSIPIPDRYIEPNISISYPKIAKAPLPAGNGNFFETEYLSKDKIIERPSKKPRLLHPEVNKSIQRNLNYSSDPSVIWKYFGGIECTLENFDFKIFDFASNPFVYYPVHVELMSKDSQILKAIDHSDLSVYGVLDKAHSSLIAPLISRSILRVSAAFFCTRNTPSVPILVSCYALSSQSTFIQSILNKIPNFNKNYPALELVKSKANSISDKGSYGKIMKTSMFSAEDSDLNPKEKVLFRKLYLEDLLGPLAIQNKKQSETNYSITSESNLLVESNKNTDHMLDSVFKDLNYSKNKIISKKKNQDVDSGKNKKNAEYKTVSLRLPDDFIEPGFDRYTFNDSSSIINSLSGIASSSKEINPSSDLAKKNLDLLKSNIFTLTNLPEASVDSRVKTKMHRHQRQALHFMLARETDGTDILDSKASLDGSDIISSIRITDSDAGKNPIQESSKYKLSSIWSQVDANNNTSNDNKGVYLNSITGIKKVGRPNPCLGGILADDMGLGKTLTVISLILSKSPEFKLGTFAKSKANGSSSEDSDDLSSLRVKTKKIKSRLRKKKNSKILYSDLSTASSYEENSSFESDNGPPVSKFILGGSNESVELKNKENPKSLSLCENSIKSRGNIQIDQQQTKFSTEEKAESQFSEIYRGVIYSGTLIICPLSTVYNWEDQIKVHTARGALKTYIYHGADRERSTKYLSKFDVVITTYNILYNEYSREVRQLKSKNEETFTIPKTPYVSPLQHLFWDRVVLDEAHIIKDRKTWQSRAACSLSARSRWCLTGTPIQNRIDDLFSLIKFLHFSPLDLWYTWVKYVGTPFHSNLSNNFSNLKSDKPNIGAQRAQMIIQTLCLRRMKDQVDPSTGKKYLDLPSITYHNRILEFSKKERELYDGVSYKAKKAFDEFVNKDSVLRNYMSILSYILRLRQLCVHPSLVDESYNKIFSSSYNSDNETHNNSRVEEKMALMDTKRSKRDLFSEFKDAKDTKKKPLIDKKSQDFKDEESHVLLDDEEPEIFDTPKNFSEDCLIFRRNMENHIHSLSKNSFGTGNQECEAGLEDFKFKFIEDSSPGACLHTFCRSCKQEALSDKNKYTHCLKCQGITKADPSFNASDRIQGSKHNLKRNDALKIQKISVVELYSDSEDHASTPTVTPTKCERPNNDRINDTRKTLGNNEALSSSIYSQKLNRGTNPTNSTKVVALLKDLLEIEKRNLVDLSDLSRKGFNSQSSSRNFCVDKSVVFSQWTSMLDIIQKSLVENNIKYARLDGTMSRIVRQRQQENFAKDDNCTVMLVSLKAGGKEKIVDLDDLDDIEDPEELDKLGGRGLDLFNSPENNNKKRKNIEDISFMLSMI
ncbi:Helicase-like transcription factor [Smittium mucronatum]|uniref:Helicase-like transcription factor n=1 Tax=Smittium mucronatum TaxID=133383 RepID=A0A1R0GU21_9FUNG|nr:Helicase-like transcription factor [Smittium mucronatum]